MRNSRFLYSCFFLGATIPFAFGQPPISKQPQERACRHASCEKCETTSHPKYTQEEMWQGRDRMTFWLNTALASNENKDRNKYFTDYALILDSLDVKISPIASFSTVSSERLQRPSIFFPNKDFRDNTIGITGTTLSGPVLEADSKDALFVYPIGVEEMNPEKMIESEIAAATEDADIDVTPFIKRISGSQAPGSANADEVIVYEFDMKEPLLDNYSHAVGVVVNKKGHYPMGFKIVLNDEGLGKKDEYVRLLLDNVRYGDTPLERCLELEQRQLLNTGPVQFPLKRVPLGCGHGETRI